MLRDGTFESVELAWLKVEGAIDINSTQPVAVEGRRRNVLCEWGEAQKAFVLSKAHLTQATRRQTVFFAFLTKRKQMVIQHKKSTREV